MEAQAVCFTVGAHMTHRMHGLLDVLLGIRSIKGWLSPALCLAAGFPVGHRIQPGPPCLR